MHKPYGRNSGKELRYQIHDTVCAVLSIESNVYFNWLNIYIYASKVNAFKLYIFCVPW